MYPTTGQPTIETIVASSALVAAMAALRKRRLARVHGYILGFSLWAALISIGWGTAKALGLPQLHFWRIYLEGPTAVATLFLSMWTFRGRRWWFLKGLALYYGLIGFFLGLDAVFQLDTNRLRSFALSWVAFALVCGLLSLRRQDGAPPLRQDSAREVSGGEPI